MSTELIRLLAVGVAAGETIRVVCPSCGGGSTEERSLGITRNSDNSLVWNCFRATCPSKGETQSNGSTLLMPSEGKVRPKFDDVTEPLSEAHLERIRTLWGITDPPNWWWAPTRGRVAMSIRSPKYTHRGWVLRDIWGRPGPKALTYPDEGEEMLSWYRKDQNARVVLVEDIPSAVRASRYVTSVALLGTHVGTDRAMEIAKYAPSVCIALDQDATGIAVQLAKRYTMIWNDPVVLPLQKDIKNMTEEELQGLLGEGE